MTPRRQRGFIQFWQTPRAALDATGNPFSGVVLLCINDNQADGSTTFADQSASAHTLTANGNVQYDNAQAPTGMTTSGLFDGTGDFLSTGDHTDYAFGTGDFTVELMARWNSTAAGLGILIAKRNSAANTKWLALAHQGTAMRWWASSTGSSWDIAVGKTVGTIATGSWFHIALVRNGTAWTPYLNGVAGSGTASSSASLFSDTDSVRIGADVASDGMNGWISNVRLTKGVALYTANFTPPTLPLPTS